ncbi:unnamed protein product [Bursaphelenchus xylophilus]|uniref:(pine wood nematode) hypothetical protein n=1 Tax=Bursaphelenchus xylophilus TaxID=6326 RepID=A0A1I7SF32_BURXY|nr:unnamed protein product [Bursaphelenchus xylophilus]CAG9078914.1 unnamed protein product [Bursaphelenchus xylophilus]
MTKHVSVARIFTLLCVINLAVAIIEEACQDCRHLVFIHNTAISIVKDERGSVSGMDLRPWEERLEACDRHLKECPKIRNLIDGFKDSQQHLDFIYYKIYCATDCNIT